MAQEGPFTPEKQLLKLIEDPKAKDASIRAQAARHRGAGILSPGSWMGRFSFFRDKSRAWARDGGVLQIDVKAINGILLLSVLALFFYFVTTVSMSLTNLKKIPALDFEIPKSAGSKTLSVASPMKDASYYAGLMAERDIFKMGRQEEELEESSGPSSGMLEAISHLRLVGISWSGSPDAMIEDSRIPRTYFLKKGEFIGEVKVKEIFTNKVILEYGTEEIELK